MSEPGFSLLFGDCREVLQLLPENSIDAVVTDPPAGIEFMGKAWDAFAERTTDQTDEWDRPRAAAFRKQSLLPFQDFVAEAFGEIHRVLKPGAHLLVWALPRTSHHTAMGLERAGFELRDCVSHIYGQGFPKSMDVSKAIDKELRVQRPVTGRQTVDRGMQGGHLHAGRPVEVVVVDTTTAGSEEARRWEGYGTALKPAVEFWLLARKPLSGGTVAKNVLKWGTGGINIDGSRVGYLSTRDKESATPQGRVTSKELGAIGAEPDAGRGLQRVEFQRPELLGRFPSNFLLSHSPSCKLVGERIINSDGHYPSKRGKGGIGAAGHRGQVGLKEHKAVGETVATWRCANGCPVLELDRQSGSTKSSGVINRFTDGAKPFGGGAGHPYETVPGHQDTGGASRFFATFHPFYYSAKASRRERDSGLAEGEVNRHPTVKPLALMRYLCRLITPPGGVVLDPFLGSGTTAVAAHLEGFSCVGIEREPEYIRPIQRRFAHAVGAARAAPG